MKKITFEDLEMWKESRRFRNRMVKLVKKFPKKERERLGYDIIDSSRAIGTMLAKGSKSSIPENIYSCQTAISFAAETLDMLIIAYDEGYIKKAQLNKCKRWYARLNDVVTRYLVFLKKQELLAIA